MMLSYYPPRLDPPLLVLLVGQPAATERADGALLPRPRARTTHHLLEAQDGLLARGSDARTLAAAAAMSGVRRQIIIIVIVEQSGGQIIVEEVIVRMDGRGRGDWLHRPGPRPSKDMDASILPVGIGIHDCIGIGGLI